MGGGGGMNPTSIISSLIYAGQAAVRLINEAPQPAPVQSAPAADTAAAAQAEAEAAEARRRAARKKAEEELLAKSRQAKRAELAGQDGPDQTLGAPRVETSTLKEKLGQ